MSNLMDSYLPPPRGWDAFEAIVFDVFTQRLQNDGMKRYGRSGQEQRGVDILSTMASGNYLGIQCKNHPGSAITTSEIDAEIAKAETFTLPLTRYIIATSAPRDAAVTAHIFAVSNKRREAGKFPVEIFFWDDLWQELARNSELVRTHYPDLFAPTPTLQPKLSVTFASGQSTVELAADWESTPPKKTREMVEHTPGYGGGPGITSFVPIWLCHEAGKAAGTTPLMLRIENQTVVEAKNVEVVIHLPDGCRTVKTDMGEHIYQSEKSKAVKKQGDVLTIELASLFHRPAFETEVIHIAFPTPETSYDLRWVATAGNILGEQQGVLKVQILGANTPPTRSFPR